MGLKKRRRLFPNSEQQHPILMAGFSLVEVMMVLSVIGVLIGVGVVNFMERSPYNQIQEAGQRLVSDLRWTRQAAISRGVDATITFETSEGEYTVLGPTTDTTTVTLPSSIHFNLSEGVDHQTNCKGDGSTWTPPSDGITFSGNQVTFRTNGLGSAGTVYLTNAPLRNETVAITVNVAGRIQLCKWNGTIWE